MSRFASSKTGRIWVERMAMCERSNASVSQFCQSIGCLPMTSCYQWKRKLAAKPQTSVFCVCWPSGPTKDSIEIKLSEAGVRLEAIGVREQPEAGVRLEAVGDREQPNSRKTLVRSSVGIQ